MNDKTLKQIQALHLEGHFADAEAGYQAILENAPESLEALHGLSILYAQTQRYDDALTCLNQAITQDPRNTVLYNSKGNVLLRLGKYQDAIKEYEAALQFNPQYALAYNNIGKAYHELEKLDVAREHYEKAITLDSEYADAYYNLGILFATLGEFKAAIEALQRAIALTPNRPAVYSQLAEVYRHEGNYAKAIEVFQKRIELQPEYTNTYFAIGQTYLQNHQPDEAIIAFEQTLTLQPKHQEAHHALANAYLAAGDPSKALNYYFRQLEVKPLMESYYNIGVLLMHQNRHKESLQYLVKAAEMDPSYLPVHINLGALYLKLKRYSEAITHYQAALEINPEDPEIQHILAALSDDNTPEKAPNEYLEHLFDQYATYYDKHLTEHLHYRAHELLYQVVCEETEVDTAAWTILDLGCGTGLCGERFKHFAQQLIGIDLSEKMIETARSKMLYDELAVMDVASALHHYQGNDFIVAGDVFSYIGNLESIFENAHSALKPGGFFAFTVEKTYVEPYELQKTIRYAHSKHYLTTLIEQYSFHPLRFDTIILRQQRNTPVEGYLLLLKS